MNSTTESLSRIKELIPKNAKILLNVLSGIKKGSIALKSPSGEYYQFKGIEDGRHVVLEVKDWKVFENILLKGDIGLGESYIEGLWECSNINDLITLAMDNESEFTRVIRGSFFNILLYRIKHLFNRNTKKGSKKNIRAHYDLGNDFYQLWLDRSMTYSSALFEGQCIDLEEAQKRKYQHILNQLNAKEGDHILEIGCGWGGFMEHAAKKGIKVTGVTISGEQYQYAKNRVSIYPELSTVQLQDYRDITGKFDHIVSIEMFEAIGIEYWETYFQKIKNLLSPMGKAVIQTITIANESFQTYKDGTDFIQQYIFPGGMLPSDQIFKKVANKQELQVLQETSFGLDYAKTLQLWEEAFQNKIKQVISMGYDQQFIRTWEFYLKYCQGGFESGKLGVMQYSIGHKLKKDK